MPAIDITKITISDFKRIGNLELEVSPITALVGGNTSGKSSVLQASQLSISLLQAAFRGRNRNDVPQFLGSVSDDEVAFRPTEKLLDLRRGRSATQTKGFEIGLQGLVDKGEGPVVQSFTLIVKRGKNANINLRIEGDRDFAGLLAEGENGSSVFTPGLSGISTREELRTKGALASSVMQGDANTYLRSLLYHLYENEDGRNEDNDIFWDVADWNTSPIFSLPDCKWKSFCLLLDEVYEGARITISHDDDVDRYIDIEIQYNRQEMPLDLASTGMLQVIQILAYACYFAPPLLLLDEPDAHLHADSQTKLFDALRGITQKTHTRIVLASHSPQLLQQMHRQENVTVCWMDDGAKVVLDKKNLPAIPVMMRIGALGIGADAFNPQKKVILLTEDTETKLVQIVAKSNGADDSLALISYSGCGNLLGARQLAILLRDLRPDASIVIHRDRDYRTEEEMTFEEIRSTSWFSERGVDNVAEIFTTGNDIEHAFCKGGHLQLCFPERNIDEINKVIETAIAQKRDDLVAALDKARLVLKESLYDTPRHRKNPAWVTAGLTDKCKLGSKFRPADSTEPFPFDSCHGKVLEIAARKEIGQVFGGGADDIIQKVHQVSEGLKDPRWQGKFNPN
ncbi:AAA family ATPase [Leisingera sp. M523]|uniref:AAA family ATPase n=1 Tax=Leisingera sp. M523 TaxID=2867013 RepID=UPI0021A6C650|nr:ATP-binding protein [Leisingera sp. M523]UWQ29041.1 ATP-binding protein [Leisingera sp. M523]